MRPIIGVTSQPKSTKGSSGELDSHVIGHTYTDAVLRAGGLRVILSPVPNEEVSAIVDRLDGLLISGGGDIEPQRYGEEPHPSRRFYGPARDEFEIALTREAHARHLPVLAISGASRS